MRAHTSSNRSGRSDASFHSSDHTTNDYNTSEYDRPVADNPTFGNEPKNKD